MFCPNLLLTHHPPPFFDSRQHGIDLFNQFGQRRGLAVAQADLHEEPQRRLAGGEMEQFRRHFGQIL